MTLEKRLRKVNKNYDRHNYSVNEYNTKSFIYYISKVELEGRYLLAPDCMKNLKVDIRTKRSDWHFTVIADNKTKTTIISYNGNLRDTTRDSAKVIIREAKRVAQIIKQITGYEVAERQV